MKKCEVCDDAMPKTTEESKRQYEKRRFCSVECRGVGMQRPSVGYRQAEVELRKLADKLKREALDRHRKRRGSRTSDVFDGKSRDRL